MTAPRSALANKERRYQQEMARDLSAGRAAAAAETQRRLADVRAQLARKGGR